MISSRKHELLQSVIDHTSKHIEDESILNIGISTKALSQKLYLDRANVSRLLNQLHQEGQLIKILGRPVHFVAKEVLMNHYSVSYLPTQVMSFEDLITYFSSKSISKSNDLSFIGSQINESLNPIQKVIESIIINHKNSFQFSFNGPIGIGKTFIINQIINYLTKRFTIDNQKIVTFNCLQSSFEIISEHIKANHYTIIYLKYWDYLMTQDADKAIYYLKDWMNDSEIILIENETYIDHQHHTQLLHLVTQSFNLPLFHQKSIKERLAFIIEFVQTEANHHNQTIVLSKDIVNCFLTAYYHFNLIELKQMIKTSILHSYSSNHQNQFTKIEFDDLPDELLANITEVEKNIPYLENIHLYLDTKIFYFIPQTSSQATKYLETALLNEQRMIEPTAKYQNIKTIEELCHYHLKSNLNMTTIKPHSHFIHQCLLYLNHPITTYPNLLQGLIDFFNHLQSNRNHKLNQLSYPKPFAPSQALYKLRTYLNQQLTSPLTDIENVYIETYLEISNYYLSGHKIMIILIGYDKQILDHFIRYAHSFSNEIIVHSIIYTTEDQNNPFNKFKNKMIDFIHNIPNKQGLIFLSDIDIISRPDELLSSEFTIPMTSFSPISFPIFLQILKLLKKGHRTIDSFTSLNIESFKDDTFLNDKLLLKLEKKILYQSLVFLDAHKTSQLLFKVLLMIVEELKIDIHDELIIRFIVHCSFAIERILKKESYRFKSLTSFIKQHSIIFQIIERHFNLINNTFGILITTDELASITSILIDYLD